MPRRTREQLVDAWAIKARVRDYRPAPSPPPKPVDPNALPRWPVLDIDKLREGLERFRGVLWP